ncbi:MAG: PEP-CTERM sorting domain-containing protein [Proteobacteria bacterium]|nr:PEP-CTERM sorting domain-containing protein [Pseudomonadota bacterium]
MIATTTRALGLAALCVVLSAAAAPARADLTWSWSYAGPGIAATGTFVTDDTPDGAGFYQITDISGQRNGVVITGLQPTGTPIPGNEPYAVDNLVSPAVPALTGDGFGYAMQDGTYANVFWAEFLPTPGYLEFFSAPLIATLAASLTTELPVTFSAILIPEPASVTLIAAAAALGLTRTRRRRSAGPA